MLLIDGDNKVIDVAIPPKEKRMGAVVRDKSVTRLHNRLRGRNGEVSAAVFPMNTRIVADRPRSPRMGIQH